MASSRDRAPSRLSPAARFPSKSLAPAKQLPNIEVRESPVPSSPSSASAPASTWTPGAARQVPWLGIAALLATTLCSIACGLVLHFSDGQRTDRWRFSPTVYVAILSTAANITLAFALAEGAAIAWWALAVRGAPVRELHHCWQHGTGLWSSLRGLARPDRVGLAVLVTTLALANGPLLQRASAVASREVHGAVPVVATLASQIPGGYTGRKTGRVTGPSRMTQEFAAVMSQYTTRAPMTGSFAGECPGTCFMTVQAAALAKVDCSTTSVPLNYSAAASPSVDLHGGGPIGETWPAFAVDFDWQDNEDSNMESVNMTVGYAKTEHCAGEYVTQSCLLRPATAEYDIKLQNGIVNFASRPTDPPIVALAANGNPYGFELTMGGLSLAANDSFSANVSVYLTGVYGYQFLGLNTFAMGYVDNLEADDCQRAWRDPTDDIMASLNEIVFRISLNQTHVNATANAMDNGWSQSQDLEASHVQSVTVFETWYAPVWVAILLMILGVISVFCTFLEWWKLGKPLTLDPMETARAFQAPIFSDQPRNVPLDALIKRTGDRMVRYEQPGPGHARELQWVWSRPGSISRTRSTELLVQGKE